jgi:hypothetical protein
MSDATATDVRYPECTVELLGSSANAVAIFMRVARHLLKYLQDVEGLGLTQAEALVKEFKDEATSGDYDNVLATCFRWVDVC